MQHDTRALALLAITWVAGCASAPVGPAPDGSTRPALSHYNLSENVAIQGFDPVAYFPEHGGSATKGSEQFEYTYDGATYHFANEANRETFAESPSKFEPAYGGWCAYAMQDGEKVAIDPKYFLVQDERLMLFYKGLVGNDTREMWLDGDEESAAEAADEMWMEVSGESR